MRFGVLGSLSVIDNDRTVEVTSRKRRLVLAMLLRHANRSVSSDLLIDALWGERPPPSALANLRVYAHHLRRVLGAGDRISWVSPGYALTVHPGELDVCRFEELVRRGCEAHRAADAAAANAMLWEALELWRGPAYAGLTECPPLHDEATRLEELRLTAVEERLSTDLDLGRHHELVADLRTLSAEHPLREGFRAHLMLALYRSGRQADALGVYRDTWTTLTEELGIEPGRRLRALEEAILAGDPALDPPEPGRTTVGAGPQPPLASGVRPPPAPGQLPPDAPGFTGRDPELARLDGLLLGAGDQPTAVAIAAVSGTAGVGKTALAVHWAHRVRDRFPDGSLFVDLRGYDASGVPAKAEEVLEGFLRALGVPPAAVPPTLEERAALFRTQLNGRRMLIVLDNAATSGQVRWLLPGSAGCLVVVTSRGRLSGLAARDGARRIPVDLLSPAEALALLRHAMGPARVDAEPDAAGELTRLCAYLPLALRLAAERSSARPHLTLADLTRDLADEYERLNLLAADDDATAVRAAFSWSYRALAPDAARAFRLLGLHPGPDMSLAAAAALIDAGRHETRELLDALVDAHLLRECARDRYGFHDLLRDYAVDRAQDDEPATEREAAVRRVLDWYLHTADVADRILMPRRRHIPLDRASRACRPVELASPSTALEWCEAERLNLVAATRHAARTDQCDVAWKLPYALWGYFSVRTRWTDWIATHLIGIDAARRSRERYGESLLLTSLANAYRDVGRFEDAFDQFNGAVAVSREIGEPWVEAAALTLLSIAYRDLGRRDAALNDCLRALRIFRRIADPWGESWALYHVGEIYGDLRRYDEAIEHSQQALALFGRIDDHWGKSRALFVLGQIYRDIRRFDEAADYATRAIAAAREIGNRHGEALALYTLGKVHNDIGRTDSAKMSWRQALGIFEQLGAPQATKVRARLASSP